MSGAVLRLGLTALDELDWESGKHSGNPILFADFHELRLVVQALEGEAIFGEPDLYWNWWITSPGQVFDLRGELGGGEGVASEAEAMAAVHAAAVAFIAGFIETIGGRRVNS